MVSTGVASVFLPHSFEATFVIVLVCAATLHLYYARFMTHFLEKLGLTNVQEPFQNLIPVGVVMGESYRVTRTGRYITKDQVEQSKLMVAARHS